jgi:transposase-like protein
MVYNDKEARSVNELNDAKKKIKTLEKELKRLREENTVLKKAERIFPGKK